MASATKIAKIFVFVIFFGCLLDPAAYGNIVATSSFTQVDRETMGVNELHLFTCRFKTQCASACRETDQCVAFTFDPTRVTCQLHGLGHSGSAPPGESSAVYWNLQRLNWHGSACTDDTDCTVTEESLCFEGNCLCTPGYYYSVGTRRCVATCPEKDLQTTAAKYPNHYLKYNNDLGSSLAVLTAQACVEWCVGHGQPSCRTVDYQRALAQCSRSSLTALDAPDSWRANSPSQANDHYQRMCA